eukprot:1022000-Rhodomonas_salina.1
MGRLREAGRATCDSPLLASPHDSGFTAVRGAGGGMRGMTGVRRACSVALSSPAPFSAAAAR